MNKHKISTTLLLFLFALGLPFFNPGNTAAYTQGVNEYPTQAELSGGSIPTTIDAEGGIFETWMRTEIARGNQKGLPAPGILEGGLVATSPPPSGLGHTITQVKGWVNGVYVDNGGAKAKTYNGTKTTYVFLNNVTSKTTEYSLSSCVVTRNGYLVFYERTLNAQLPSSVYTSDLVPIMRVDTNAATITKVTDLRPAGAVNSDYYGSNLIHTDTIGSTGKMPTGKLIISHQVNVPNASTNATTEYQDVSVERGGKIIFATNDSSITFNGQFTAGNYQVFEFPYATSTTNAGTTPIQVKFKGGTVVNPVWFGLKPEDKGKIIAGVPTNVLYGDSNRFALQMAALSVGDYGGAVETPAGYYYVNINSANDFIPLKYSNTAFKGTIGGGTNFMVYGGDYDFIVANPDATETGENLLYKAYTTELSVEHSQLPAADITGATTTGDGSYIGTFLRIKNERQGEASNLHVVKFKKGIVLQTRENFYIWRNWFYNCTEGIAVDKFGINTAISTQTTSLENNQMAACYKGVAINTDWADFRLHKNSYALGNHDFIGIYMVTGDQDISSNMTILNESFENAGPNGTLLWVHNERATRTGRNITIQGCNFGSGQGTAIKLEAARNVNIVENVFATSPTASGTLYDISRNCQSLVYRDNKQGATEPTVWRPGKSYSNGEAIYSPNPSWLNTVYKATYNGGGTTVAAGATNPFTSKILTGVTIGDGSLTWTAVRIINGTIPDAKWESNHTYALDDVVRPTGYYEGYGWKLTAPTGGGTSTNGAEPAWPYVVGPSTRTVTSVDEANSSVTWISVPYKTASNPVVWTAGMQVSTNPNALTYVYDPGDASATIRYVMWKGKIRVKLGDTEPNWVKVPTATTTDNGVTWTPVLYDLSLRNGAVRPSIWKPSNSYATGTYVYPTTFNGFMYRAPTTGGPWTSGSAEPTWQGTIPDTSDTGTGGSLPLKWVATPPSDASYYKRWTKNLEMYIGDMIAPSINPNSLIYTAFLKASSGPGPNSPFHADIAANNKIMTTYPDITTPTNQGLVWTCKRYDALLT